MSSPSDVKENNYDELKLNQMKVEQEIKTKLLKEHQRYRTTLTYMSGDIPIGVLCLPKLVEDALIAADCLRVYDLFDRDLTEIKGIGSARARDLAARLDQFLSMC